MTDPLIMTIRLALSALANMYGFGKVTIIEMFSEDTPIAGRADSPNQVVNVDVTGHPALRDQLAEAVIGCPVFHSHEPGCYPWEEWTTDGGAKWRGMVGQLLTMWVRLEELTGYVTAPAASDPAVVPADPITEVRPPTEPAASWIDSGDGPGYSRMLPRFGEDLEPRGVRPYVTAMEAHRARHQRPTDLSGAAAAGTLGIASVDGALTPEPHPLALLLDDHPEPGTETARLEAAFADRADVVIVPGADADSAPSRAWRAWAMASIEQDMRTAGPFADFRAAVAAIRTHPAVSTIEPEDVFELAHGLVPLRAPARNRARWWTLGGMLTRAEATK